MPERPPVYTRKAKGAQEAHEAIRPTAPHRDPDSVKPFLSAQQFRLYQLIWQRFIAIQMAQPCSTDDGRRRRRARSRDPGRERRLHLPRHRLGRQVPRLHGRLPGRTGRGRPRTSSRRARCRRWPHGEALDLLQARARAAFHPAAAALHRGDAGQGAGRAGHRPPEHLRADIATIQAAATSRPKRRSSSPTELGLVVNDLLVEHFPRVFDVGFTSQMEEELDEIASGERAWVPDAARVLRAVRRDAGQAPSRRWSESGSRTSRRARTARSAAGRW